MSTEKATYLQPPQCFMANRLEAQGLKRNISRRQEVTSKPLKEFVMFPSHCTLPLSRTQVCNGRAGWTADPIVETRRVLFIISYHQSITMYSIALIGTNIILPSPISAIVPNAVPNVLGLDETGSPDTVHQASTGANQPRLHTAMATLPRCCPGCPRFAAPPGSLPAPPASAAP